jgi:hypothetical protein
MTLQEIDLKNIEYELMQKYNNNMKAQYIKISEDGDKFYYSDKEMTVLHREDGPAYEWANGSKWWYLNGKLHHEDGPACVYADGSKSWYLNGKYYSEEKFNEKMKLSKKININGREFTIEELNSLIAKA